MGQYVLLQPRLNETYQSAELESTHVVNLPGIAGD